MSKRTVKSEIAGTVWKIEAPVGTRVELDDTIMILESMKMEIPVLSPCGGTVAEIRVAETDSVTEGQPVAVVEAG